MLNQEQKVVLRYIKHHFEKSSKPLNFMEINIEHLSFERCLEILKELDKLNLIKLNTDYIHPYVESIT